MSSSDVCIFMPIKNKQIITARIEIQYADSTVEIKNEIKKRLNELRHPVILSSFSFVVFDSKVIERFVHLDLTLKGEERKRVSN